MIAVVVTGSVAGIPGAMLDLDTFNGSIDQLRGFAADACTAGRCGPPVSTSTGALLDAARLARVDTASPPATVASGCSAGRGSGPWLVAAALGVLLWRRRRPVNRLQSGTRTLAAQAEMINHLAILQ